MTSFAPAKQTLKPKRNRERTTCIHSGHLESAFVFSKQDKFGIDPAAFEVYECKECALRFVSPRPSATDIGRFYPETYQWKENESKHRGIGDFVSNLEKAYRYHQIKTEIKKLERVLMPFPKKVLDVGCGTGDRLFLLRERGCDVYGVETSEQALYGQKKFGLNVYHGALEGACFESASFDLITLYNVLEHVHNPEQLLIEVARLLKPGGHLVVEVPNAKSFQAQWFGARWAAVDIPRDLYYFNRQSLEPLLVSHGFVTKSFDVMTNFWHPPTLVISLFPSLDPQLIWSQDKKKQGGGFVKRVFWAGFTLVLAPFVMFENLCGRGALMTFIAQKK